MVQFLIKLFVTVIITLSVIFKEVIRRQIVLCYLFIVLRLLCILKGILTGKKSGSFFVQLFGNLRCLKPEYFYVLVQLCLHLEVEVHRK